MTTGSILTNTPLPDLIPVRMLNEYTYCPRLCFLEWVEQEWEDNEWTLDGTHQHRRVDRPSASFPAAEEVPEDGHETIHARSIQISAPQLGLITKLDLIETQTDGVMPVEYKRGSIPDNEHRAWEPESVQLAAQILILRENGYVCDRGVIYYVQSRRRVEIAMDAMLEQRTLALLEQMRQMALSGEKPPPLVDSPKCPSCSLVGICLPDETRFIAQQSSVCPPDADESVRRLYPARDDACPLLVQEQGAYVGKSGEELTVKLKRELVTKVRLMEVSHVSLFGNAQITTQAMHECLKRAIPVVYYSYGGWFLGLSTGVPHKNVELRRVQFQSCEGNMALRIAQTLIRNKIQNCRILLRRNVEELDEQVIRELQMIEHQASNACNLESLLGYEGNGARVYFQAFSGMLKNNQNGDVRAHFDFQNRNRRPPRDPINALLSFAYSLLVKDCTITLLRVGFDPYLGFYHQPRYGRPALALDIMEVFRPLIADSTVITAVNNGVVKQSDFYRAAGSVALKSEGRKRFIQAYERRMDTLITHPTFRYRISYRRVLEVHARLLARFLMGEIDQPPEFTTR